MLKRIIILYILLVSASNGFTQSSIADSINTVLQSSSNDTVKIDIINELGFTLANNNAAEAMNFINLAINKSIELNDSVRLAQSYSRKGVVYYYISDYNTALEYYYLSSKICEKINCKRFLSINYNNIALVYKQQMQYPVAIKYFKESIKINKLLNEQSRLALNYNNVGIVYKSMGKLDSALYYYNKSLELNHKSGNLQYLAYNYNNIGNIHFEKQNYNEALVFFFRALSLNNQLLNKYEQANVKNNIANTYIRLGDYKQAHKYLEDNTETIQELNTTTLKIDNINIWINYFNRIKDFKNSTKYYKNLILIKDSLNLLNQKKQFELIYKLYQSEKKDQEIKFLKDKSILLAEKVKKQRTINIGEIILLILCTIIIGLIYNLLHLKNKANKKLERLVKERTSELELAKEKAELSDKLKTSFLSNISHEVRTPMNAIIGYSSIIKKTVQIGEKTLYISQIEKSTKYLLNLFENITFLAQLENNDIKVKSESFKIDDLFSDLYSQFNELLDENKLPLELNYTIESDFIGLNIKTDHNRLRQIFEHLLENAVKFTESGRIEFGMKIIKNKPTFFVTDTGMGIKDEDLPFVFEKFRQFNASEKKLISGAGISLTIVFKIIELLKGTITISSQYSRNTYVEFYIPFNT